MTYPFFNFDYRGRAAAKEARRRKELEELEEQERKRRQHEQYMAQVRQQQKEEEEYRLAYEAQERKRRQHAQHMARLRQQQKEEEEYRLVYEAQERKRRQQQQEEEEYRLAYEEAMRRRRREAEMEEHRQERLRDLAMQQQQQRQQQRQEMSEADDDTTSYDEEAEPVYRIMQGPDGRLYRVNVGKTRPKRPTSKMSVDKENEPPRVKIQPKTMTATRQSLVDKETNNEKKSIPIPIPLTASNNNESLVRRCNSKLGKDQNKLNRKKKVTIIVEDASDSEYENDDYKSPWRNRRPSAGNWLEPVEGFDNRPL